MVRTPPTSGAAPGASTSPSVVQGAARAFIRRPETKRRSLDQMEHFKRHEITYAGRSSDLLLQEVMKTFEDIPSKVLQYPQMRKDIKSYLEEHADKGLRILFELSRRLKSLEEEVSRAAGAAAVVATPAQEVATVAAVSPAKEDRLLAKLGEMEDSIFTWFNETYYKLKDRIGQLDTKMEEQNADIIEKIHEKMEFTQVDIDVATEGIVVRAQSQLEDLVGTVARDIVMETKSHIGEAVKGLMPESLPDPIPMTYARAAATGPGRRPALHSVAVTSTDSRETADEVLARVKKAVDARGTGLKVSKTRKAKNSTIILGCDTEVERDRVRAKIESSGNGLVVAPMKNKDPLVVLKDVFVDGDDEDMIRAIYTQNADVFMGLPQEDKEINIKFKKRTRNPETSHIVLQVKPKVWQRMTGAGTLYLDLQRVRVEDQSPVVQCTRCLAFGHGRKFCTESVDKCSHCGGPHLRERCPDYTAGAGPRCCNCTHSGLKNVGHNAFSAECPTRHKWDYLARSNTAYL